SEAPPVEAAGLVIDALAVAPLATDGAMDVPARPARLSGFFPNGCTSDAAGDALAAAFSAFAGAATPSATVKITCPTRSLSPSFTRTSPTVPVTDDGTSTTALSVSSSMTGSPSLMLAP